MARGILDAVWTDVQQQLAQLQYRFRRLRQSRAPDALPGAFGRLWGYIFRIHTLLILLWIWVLHQGELRGYDKSLQECEWHRWEKWPSEARPHHLAFVADPQLIDPHTYPGRPWPLSSITVSLTDKYMRRSYRTLQRKFDPDTIYFLGDLFDGGREWSTGSGKFADTDPQWKRYGMRYWLREYERFSRIFFSPGQIAGGQKERREKQIIASLPGNHDLGFGSGVQVVVRERFQAFFGDGNRVDVVGNHSFVGLDTVSLSAMDTSTAPKDLWSPTMDFLDRAQDIKHEATERFLDRTTDLPNGRLFAHKAVEPAIPALLAPRDVSESHGRVKDLPTILLSHVPLYREPGTKCGLKREKYPPADPEAEKEDRNAIRVAGGYQYQNVLSKELTTTIARKVGNVDYAFSGDDHDYCEVTHMAYPSAGHGIKEITVKSLSFAMGISRPGFVLVSLWNPVDNMGHPLPGSPGALRQTTLHTKLCLLPNQIAIFIRYGTYLILTVAVLFVHAVVATLRARSRPPVHTHAILPTDEPKHSRTSDDYDQSRATSGTANDGLRSFLAARSATARARSVSPAGSAVGSSYALPDPQAVYNVPLIEKAGYYGPKKSDDDDCIGSISTKSRATGPIRRKRFVVQTMEQLGHDVLSVGGPGLAWYFWLWRIF